MDRSFNAADFEMEDQYIPSGNWYATTYDDSNTAGSFFAENYPNVSFENVPVADKLCYSHNSTSNDFGNSNQPRPVGNDDSVAKRDDPFSIRCRIPVPDLAPVSNYQLWLESSFMCRRNERERQRVRSVNDGFSRLRNHLPRNVQIKRRQSKVETLRHAINYIRQLQTLLDSKT